MSNSDRGDPGRAAILDAVPLLALVPADARAIIEAGFVSQTFPFGTVVVGQGEPADALYVVSSGRARVLITAAGGEEVPLNSLGPGDCFGEAGLLAPGGVRTSTVRASEELEVLRLDGAVLRAIVRAHPGVGEHLELLRRRHAARDLLRRTPFGRLPAEAMAELLEALTPVSVGASEAVVEQGGPPGSLYAVVEGRLRAYREDRDVGDLAYYGPGDFFGEHSLLTGRSRAATVRAVSDCRLLELAPAAYQRLLEAAPDLRRDMATLAAQYDYERIASVPLGFADELLPADVVDRSRDGEGRGAEAAVAPDEPVEELEAVAGLPRRRRRRRAFPLVRQVDEADCGAACLAMVCRHFGSAPSLARVRQAARTGIDGTNLRNLREGAQLLGLSGRAVKVSKANLDDMALPAIVHWEGNHWVVLYDVQRERVRIADPGRGLRRLDRAELDTHWSGYSVLLEPTPALGDLPEARSSRRWLWPFVRPHLRAIAAASALALVVAALQMAVPVFTQVIVDRVLPERDVGLLGTLLFVLAGLLVVVSAGSVAQRYLLARSAVRIDGATLDFLTSKLLALPVSYFAARRTGDIQRRLSSVRQIREFAVQATVAALTSGTQLIAAVVVMVIYSPLLAGLFVASAPVYALLMRLAATRLRPVFDGLEEGFGRYASRQIDAVKGIESVKAVGAEDQLRAEMGAEFATLSSRVFRADFAVMCYQGAIQLVTLVSLGLFLWIGSRQVLAGRLSVGELVSFGTLVALANAPIVLLLSLWDELQLHSVFLGRLDDVFEEEPEQGHDHTGLRPVPTLEGRVRLEGVGFRYGPSSAPVLEGVTMDVAPGTTVAIVGRSGSGKTTLAKCLAGLVEPTEGRIHYDGVDLRELDHRSLRRRIGFVLQESYLFSATISANISLGDHEPDHEQVIWAAKAAAAHEFVTRLPLGYETRVGESGLLLSGGQRQRVAIARALYRRPPVLILDEATSALDAESEKAVKDSMDTVLAGRTSFVIAHRLSTVRGADTIVVLERGRLVEQGTHNELMARQGLYFYLVSQQLGL